MDFKSTEVMNISPVDSKFESFGWNVIAVDGHDHEAILAGLEEAKKVTDKPSVLIAKTIKGKGVSFMEDQAGWHGKAPNDDELKTALAELGGAK